MPRWDHDHLLPNYFHSISRPFGASWSRYEPQIKMQELTRYWLLLQILAPDPRHSVSHTYCRGVFRACREYGFSSREWFAREGGGGSLWISCSYVMRYTVALTNVTAVITTTCRSLRHPPFAPDADPELIFSFFRSFFISIFLTAFLSLRSFSALVSRT